MSEDKTNHVLIPALLTAAAAYFGFKGKSGGFKGGGKSGGKFWKKKP